MENEVTETDEQVAEAGMREVSSVTFVDSLDETVAEGGIQEVSSIALLADSLDKQIQQTGIGDVSSVTLLVDSLDEQAQDAGINEVSSLTLVDSLNETGLVQFPSVSFTDSQLGSGMENYQDSLEQMKFDSLLNGEGLDHIMISLDSLTDSHLDCNTTNDFHGEEESSWNADCTFQNSRWASLTDLNRTVFGNETTYENLDVLEDENIYTVHQENRHESTIQQFDNPISPTADSQLSAASTVSLGLQNLWDMATSLPDDQNHESTFMEPEGNNESDDEANQSTLTLGDEGREAEPCSNSSGSGEEVESGSGSGNQSPVSGSESPEVDYEDEDAKSDSDSNVSDYEPPQPFRGKKVLATSADVQKAKIVIANYLHRNQGWNRFREECESTVHEDNRINLELMVSTWRHAVVFSSLWSYFRRSYKACAACQGKLISMISRCNVQRQK